MQTPRYIHIAKYNRGGMHVLHTLCGRRVGLMSCSTEESATCPRCIAESLTRPVAPVEK